MWVDASQQAHNLKTTWNQRRLRRIDVDTTLFRRHMAVGMMIDIGRVRRGSTGVFSSGCLWVSFDYDDMKHL